MGQQSNFTRDFILQLQGAADVPLDQCTRVLRGVASTVGEALVVGNEYGDGTPVDTGAARGAWVGTIGEDDAGGLTGRLDKSGAETLMAAQLAISELELGDVFNWTNDMAYIEELNNGHSQQAPAGMTDRVVLAFPQIVEREAARVGVSGGSVGGG